MYSFFFVTFQRDVGAVGCPGAVYILMLILLPQREVAKTRSDWLTQVISCEPFPHSNWSRLELIGQWKGKVDLKILEGDRRVRDNR